MNVEKVKRFGLEDFEHFGSERQRVGRMVEERVADDFHFMKVNALRVEAQADRRGVTDEMDLVTAGGKFHSKLGGDDAGAAVGGIAGDADAHGKSFRFSVFSSKSEKSL